MQKAPDFFISFIDLLKLMLQMRNSETGNTEVDYLISPVRNSSGGFYNSNDYKGLASSALPVDADANGAFNIARKGLWIINQFKLCADETELKTVNIAMTNAEWLEYAQSNG